MKTLKITTDNKISIIDVDLDNYRALQQEIVFQNTKKAESLSF